MSVAPELVYDPATMIEAAIPELDFALDPDRLNKLTAMAKNTSTRPGEFYDPDNGITVDPIESYDRNGTTGAKVDFIPKFESASGLIAAHDARPELATQIAHKSIEGIQNYIVLVNASVLEKPDVLFGKTGAEMAIVAERLGFTSGKSHEEIRQAGRVEIAAPFLIECLSGYFQKT